MSIRVKKIGSVVETRVSSVRIYGEIVDNKRLKDGMPIYDVLLDNGDTKEFGHYELTLITKNNDYGIDATRKSISENPLKTLGEWITLPLEKWEAIINNLPDDLKKDLKNISNRIKETKEVYKLK